MWRRVLIEVGHRYTKAILVLGVLCLGLVASGIADDRAVIDRVGRGTANSIAVDGHGNLHVVYLSPESKVIYAFRPADSEKWFKLTIVESTHSTQNIFPRIALDTGGRPHVCVATGELMYISLGDKKWATQIIDPGSGTLSYHCSIAVAPDGTPHLSWYHEFLPGGRQFTHLRHAYVENGTWVVRSVDGGISGKWNSMVLDSEGRPHLSYSQFAYGGDLRYASWSGKEWEIGDVDSSRNASTARGFDNSLAIGVDGGIHISYFDDATLKYAHKTDNKWALESVANVAAGYDHYSGSTTMLLDKSGSPHIIFGDFGGVRHAFRQGDKWETEVIVGGGIQQYPNVDAVMLPDDTLYVSYRDPQDGYVKVAVVKPNVDQAGKENTESPAHQQKAVPTE